MTVLRNPRYSTRVFSFSDDDVAAPDTGSTAAAPVDAASPDYTFDGYSIELNQKITLTPIAPHHRHARKPEAAR